MKNNCPEIFKGSFFEDVFRILEKGEFKDPGQSIGRGEKVIGKMWPLEKAFYTHLSSVVDELGRVRDKLEKFDEMTIKELGSLEEHVVKVGERADAIKDITFILIKDRLNLTGSGYALREGFKVVSTPPDEVPDLLGSLLRKRGIGVRVIRIPR